MQKTKFKFNENDYKIIVQTRRSLGAVRVLENCCLEACIIHEKEAPVLIKSTVNYTLRSLCWTLAGYAVAEAAVMEKTGQDPLEFDLPGGKKYDPMKPVKVPGTSKGVAYDTLLTTHNGIISYFHGKIEDESPKGKPPRIRLVKTDPALPWPEKYINDTGMTFSTTENTHMSHTAESAAGTKKLIARGAFILINIKKEFE